MHFKLLKTYVFVFLAAMLFSGCSSRPTTSRSTNPLRSVYFWRTSFQLSAAESNFIEKHNINRIYLRLFDVVNCDDKLMPQATLQFLQPVPDDVEIVPVVFLSVDALNDTAMVARLPELIVKRVGQMLDANEGISNDSTIHKGIAWKELQVDFDWTSRNQAHYFQLLSKMRTLLKEKQRSLSATIRLHQLSMTAPPVDYGALMVYNIGKFANYDEVNSILTVETLRPYLQHLSSYSLPLATALPVFSWNLLFREKRFQSIVRGIDIADTTRFTHLTDNRYRVNDYVVVSQNALTTSGAVRLYPGDVIRHEDSDIEVLRQTCTALKKRRANSLDEVILYSLEEENIKRYNDEEIETVFGAR